jgi:hypothetical protein
MWYHILREKERKRRRRKGPKIYKEAGVLWFIKKILWNAVFATVIYET